MSNHDYNSILNNAFVEAEKEVKKEHIRKWKEILKLLLG